jgi:hypothetical protein
MRSEEWYCVMCGEAMAGKIRKLLAMAIPSTVEATPWSYHLDLGPGRDQV